jgi:hypothetical protein
LSPLYIITVEPLPPRPDGPNDTQHLRQALKRMLRYFLLRCIEITAIELPDAAHQAAPAELGGFQMAV